MNNNKRKTREEEEGDDNDNDNNNNNDHDINFNNDNDIKSSFETIITTITLNDNDNNNNNNNDENDEDINKKRYFDRKIDAKKISLANNRKNTIISLAQTLHQKCNTDIILIFKNEKSCHDNDKSNIQVNIFGPDFIKLWENTKLKQSFMDSIKNQFKNIITVMKEEQTKKLFIERKVEILEENSLKGNIFLVRKRTLIKKIKQLYKNYEVPCLLIIKDLTGDIEIVTIDKKMKSFWNKTQFKPNFMQVYSDYCFENNKIILRQRKTKKKQKLLEEKNNNNNNNNDDNTIRRPFPLSNEDVTFVDDVDSHRLNKHNIICILKFRKIKQKN